MSKRSQESSSPGSPAVKARACCLVSRHGVSVGQPPSSNQVTLISRGVRDTLKSGTRAKGVETPDVILLGMPRETLSVCSEDSGGLAETQASGNREYMRKVVQNMKDRLGHNESVSEISMDSEKMHISIWTRFMASSMQAALRKNWKYSRILVILTALMACSVLQE